MFFHHCQNSTPYHVTVVTPYHTPAAGSGYAAMMERWRVFHDGLPPAFHPPVLFKNEDVYRGFYAAGAPGQ